MAWIKFRTERARKGVNHAPGDVLEVEGWEAESLIALGKARACDAPATEAPAPEPEDDEAELILDTDGHDEAPMFKSGSIPEEGPAKIMRRKAK